MDSARAISEALRGQARREGRVRRASPGGRVRRAALACIWAGGLGAIVSTVLAFLPAGAEPGVYNYPMSAGVFTVVQVFFGVQFFVLGFGTMGLWWSRVVPTSLFGPVGALSGAGAVALLGVVHLVAIAAVGQSNTTLLVDVLNASFGVVSAAFALSLVLAGIAVIRGQFWAGPGKYVPLALGLYVFLPLIPALLGPFIVARLAISGWLILFVALGIALRKWALPV